MRVVEIAEGRFEERKLDLTPADAPWIFAAQRHLEWLAARLAR